ncbi:hypothetical protein K438DRAFT_2116851 [Mycena galopus ATCC 62051]|nr:hypothetical protein K438DRAFT_2116851 [Mycena galopus ATCC 62051]
MTLCIRLFSELLLGRYNVDIPPPEQSLLAQHAHDLFEENRVLLANFGGHHSPEFNSVILPQSQIVIEALGDALAALKRNLPQPLLDMYECTAMHQDPAWYCEAGISHLDQRLREDRSDFIHASGIIPLQSSGPRIDLGSDCIGRELEARGQLT